MRENRLSYCNAGHNPPLLLSGGQLRLLMATGLPLAMMEGVPYTGGSEPFGAGDTLVIYSDGIPEALVQKDFYGDDRLRALATTLAGSSRPRGGDRRGDSARRARRGRRRYARR